MMWGSAVGVKRPERAEAPGLRSAANPGRTSSEVLSVSTVEDRSPAAAIIAVRTKNRNRRWVLDRTPTGSDRLRGYIGSRTSVRRSARPGAPAADRDSFVATQPARATKRFSPPGSCRSCVPAEQAPFRNQGSGEAIRTGASQASQESRHHRAVNYRPGEGDEAGTGGPIVENPCSLLSSHRRADAAPDHFWLAGARVIMRNRMPGMSRGIPSSNCPTNPGR